MEMATVLGSFGNLHELVKMPDVINSTKFGALANAWRKRTTRSTDYHAGRIGMGGYFFYYEPWLRRIIDAQTAKPRAAANRFLP